MNGGYADKAFAAEFVANDHKSAKVVVWKIWKQIVISNKADMKKYVVPTLNDI